MVRGAGSGRLDTGMLLILAGRFKQTPLMSVFKNLGLGAARDKRLREKEEEALGVKPKRKRKKK